MTELSEAGITVDKQSAADAVTRFAGANRRVLDFIFGVQTAVLEEMLSAGNEMLDRARTEMHLFTELTSKLAGAHSIKDVKTACEECGQSQIDFVRRDRERLLKHGQRMVETTSNLFSKQAKD
jgi:hypothetical protein